jgi:biotin transport system substrate-specific component
MMPTFLTVVLTRSDDRALQLGERIGAVALITALTAAAAQISIPLPFTPVPLTFQPMVVLVGAMALGARLGMTSQLIYLALGIAGLPVFAASPTLPQGLARLFGPTGGYLMAFPFAAYLVGSLAQRGLDRRYLTSVLAMLCGLAIVFASGVLWLRLLLPASRGMASALAAGFYPFVLADLVKLLVAAAVMPQLWKLTGSSGTR